MKLRGGRSVLGKQRVQCWAGTLMLRRVRRRERERETKERAGDVDGATEAQHGKGLQERGRQSVRRGPRERSPTGERGSREKREAMPW